MPKALTSPVLVSLLVACGCCYYRPCTPAVPAFFPSMPPPCCQGGIPGPPGGGIPGPPGGGIPGPPGGGIPGPPGGGIPGPPGTIPAF